MSWWLADESTPHLYNLKCLSWFWENQTIHFCTVSPYTFYTYSILKPLYQQLPATISPSLSDNSNHFPSEFLLETPCLNEMTILSLSSLRCILEVQANHFQFVMMKCLPQPLLITQLLLWTQARCSTLLICYRLKILSVLSSRTWLSLRRNSAYQNPMIWKIGAISATELKPWKITSMSIPIQFPLIERRLA